MVIQICLFGWESVMKYDFVWCQFRDEVQVMVVFEFVLFFFVYEIVFNYDSLEEVVVYWFGDWFGCDVVLVFLIWQIYLEVLVDELEFVDIFWVDIVVVFDCDLVCFWYLELVFYFKGFYGLQMYCFVNWLWCKGCEDFVFYLQSCVLEVFQIDIYLVVLVGCGIFIDYGMGIVIGGIVVLEDDVFILQGVIFGGIGKESGDWYLKICYGVLIGVGVKVFGNLEIGYCSCIVLGLVVFVDVFFNFIVVGVFVKIVGKVGCLELVCSMN